MSIIHLLLLIVLCGGWGVSMAVVFENKPFLIYTTAPIGGMVIGFVLTKLFN